MTVATGAGFCDDSRYRAVLQVDFAMTVATGAMTVATGAVVFEFDLALRLAFFVAFTLWWRRPGAASQASHLCARM